MKFVRVSYLFWVHTSNEIYSLNAYVTLMCVVGTVACWMPYVFILEKVFISIHNYYIHRLLTSVGVKWIKCLSFVLVTFQINFSYIIFIYSTLINRCCGKNGTFPSRVGSSKARIIGSTFSRRSGKSTVFNWIFLEISATLIYVYPIYDNT